MTQGLFERPRCECLLACEAQETLSLVVVGSGAGLKQMVGEGRGMARRIGVGFFDAVCYSQMKPLQPGKRQAGQESLSNQLVAEAVAGTSPSAGLGSGLDQLELLGSLDGVEHDFGVALRNDFQQLVAEPPSDHCRCPEH